MKNNSSERNAPFEVILRCVRTQSIFKVLIPLAMVFVILSSYTNMMAKRLFKEANNLYIHPELKGLDSALEVFRNAMGSVMFHYLLSQISSFLIGFLSLRIFRAFLVESLSHSISLEYTKFHSRGSSVVQDDITRSSKAAREIFVILFFDTTYLFIDITLSIKELFLMLNLEYFLKMMLLSIIGITLAIFVAIYSYKTDRKNLVLYRDSLNPLSDTLNNFDIVKSFNTETSEVQQYNRALLPHESASTTFYMRLNIMKFFQKCFLLLPNMMIYYYIAIGKQDVWRTGHSTVLSIVYYNNIFSGFKKDVVTIRDHILHYVKHASQMNANDTLFKKDSGENIENLPDKKSFDVQISLENVELYAGNNLIQRNQSFKILKNEKVAITGTNGAGKSVFMKTLLKFFKNEGNFYIDDQLIQNISTKSLRKLISYTPQDPHIFNNTVMYNLAYSQNPKDEQKVFAACQRFGLHEFFKSLKDGYYTMAGEKGKYLSGGQKQRISLMRSIIKEAPILLMDEPTANIDKKSEHELFDKVLENCHDRTFILIVHNPELLCKFDKIIHFDKTGITCFNSYEDYIKQYK